MRFPFILMNIEPQCIKAAVLVLCVSVYMERERDGEIERETNVCKDIKNSPVNQITMGLTNPKE